MKKITVINKIKLWTIAEIIFVIIVGSLLHFTYEWSGQNIIVGAFSATNESVFEHTKMIYFPVLIFSMIEFYFLEKSKKGFLNYKFFGVLMSLSYLCVFFYTYTGMCQQDYLFIDIFLFVQCAIIPSLFANYNLKKVNAINNQSVLSITGFIILTIVFIVFSYYPPTYFLPGFFQPLKFG